MCADHIPIRIPTPALGTLVRDMRRDRVGEFRGECCGRWYLRPVRGGREWDAAPADVQLADPAQRLRAGAARANARSRGELL